MVTAAFEHCHLAGNRLNLDVYPAGCREFLELFEKRRDEVAQVEFLRLNCNEALIDATLGSLPLLKSLKSLVLKGKTWRSIPTHSSVLGSFLCS